MSDYETTGIFLAIGDAKRDFFSYKQGPNETLTEFYNKFQELLSVVESLGGRIHDPISAAPPYALADIAALTSDAERDNYMRDRSCAAIFLLKADGSRYEYIRTQLHNRFLLGRDEYPKSLDQAYQLLLYYKATP